jgi:hypothetical protein
MEEDLEQRMAEFVAGLSPEEYERLGPALREFGLAVAERRELERELEGVRGDFERALETVERALENLQRW